MNIKYIDMSGKLLQAQRSLAGLSVEKLAFKSGCSKRTIENIERADAKSVQRVTLTKLADGLGVPAQALVKDGAACSPEPDERMYGWHNEVQIVFQGDFQQFDESDELRAKLEMIHLRSRGRGKIVILAISETNSIAVELAITGEDCLGLVQAYCGERLDDQGIVSIVVQVSDGSPPGRLSQLAKLTLLNGFTSLRPRFSDLNDAEQDFLAFGDAQRRITQTVRNAARAGTVAASLDRAELKLQRTP